jgi:glyoxylase-like metal-dependent hydrolase (beta-lactamase superfamily II)
MTGPGTNTYLVGIDEVAVIDPGPADDGHIDAIIGASMRDRVRWVLLTHTHPDHWPAARRIREETGAVIAGFVVMLGQAAELLIGSQWLARWGSLAYGAMAVLAVAGGVCALAARRLASRGV